MEAPTPIIELSNYFIRPFYPGDVEAISKEGNNPEIARWLRNRFPDPYTIEDAKAWISIATSSSPILDFVISRREDNVAIGAIGFKARDDVYYRTMEIGYWLGQDHWGKGIATEALSAMTAWAFENFTHVLRLEAEVYDGNDGSQRVLVKAGYELEGRRKKAVEKNGIVDVTPLGEPLHFAFSQRTAPNRFYKGAMTERLSSWSPTDLKARGIPSNELINLYKRWGESGYGMISTGNIMLAYDQLEAPGNPIIDLENPFHGERFEAFSRMAAESKKHGSLIVAQVSHPGRQVEERVQADPVSASDVQLQTEALKMKFAKPHAATKDEIRDLIKRWTHAAVYLHKAGFDGIQLHGAHGYLLAQFLSQTTNKRTDEYGGSLENRARLIVEVARSIRQELPSSSGFILGIKINSVEFQAEGFTPAEAQQLCQILEQNEFDFVELSGGTYEAPAFSRERDSTRNREAFFLEFASMITPVLSKTKSYVTGGLRTTSGMVAALETVDGVGLARPACQEFNLPRDILGGRVTGVIEQKVDQQNFGLTSAAAGTQMKQVGKDEQPIDLSDEKNLALFMKHLGEWAQQVQEDAPKMNMYGFMDLPKGEAFRG
ncbi:hypothetical protein BDV33DRAFT_192245 [Aspergillus novoparasiticus]|uniref:N-acetyltransferase domain-containing protein n=1 Tax=Aspergillus novoparasiticus TaxID=986946 RepID=A0A5N6EQQ3_9EURO|nr:hypothetical protein BDV33DRAFT_192245 [Aspergillus novoparasiticus]